MYFHVYYIFTNLFYSAILSMRSGLRSGHHSSISDSGFASNGTTRSEPEPQEGRGRPPGGATAQVPPSIPLLHNENDLAVGNVSRKPPSGTQADSGMYIIDNQTSFCYL